MAFLELWHLERPMKKIKVEKGSVVSNVVLQSSTLRVDKWLLDVATWSFLVILSRAVLTECQGEGLPGVSS